MTDPVLASALPAPKTPAENARRLLMERCVPANKPKGGSDPDRKVTRGRKIVNRAFLKRDGEFGKTA